MNWKKKRSTHIITFICLLTITNFTVQSQNSVHDILNNGQQHSKHNIHVDLVDDIGNHSSIPISIIKGKESGPIFTLVSGIHGFEYSSIIASNRLIQEIDPELLAGTIIIVPLANPNSFYRRTPFVNPQDNQNLNRAFPGNKNGSITERIAHFLTTEIIAKSDVFIDIHGGDANEDLLPFIGYYNNKQLEKQTEKIKKLAEVTGFNHIISWPYNLQANQPAKYAFKQAVQDGKIALIIEAGKLGNVQEEAVNMIKTAVYNMLIELKIYQKEKSTSTGFTILNKQAYIRSEHKGIFFSDHAAGDKVIKGDTIGLIKNEFGEILIELTAPSSGIILYKTSTPPVNIGETIMCISYKAEN